MSALAACVPRSRGRQKAAQITGTESPPVFQQFPYLCNEDDDDDDDKKKKNEKKNEWH